MANRGHACLRTGACIVVIAVGILRALPQVQCDSARVACGEYFNQTVASDPYPAHRMSEVVDAIAFETGEHTVKWTKKNVGQMVRTPDGSKFQLATGWEAKTPLPEGIRATVEWWRNHDAQ